MSQTKQFECPECQTSGQHTMEKRVCISKTPQLKEDIISGTYFEWVCPGCAKRFFVDDVFLYNDDENKFMVYLVPGYDEETLPVPTLLKTDSDYDTAHSTLRVTASFIDFAEKIKILEAGLNDRIVEAIKALYASVHSETWCETVYNILFEGVGENGELNFDVFLEKDDFSFGVPRDVYDKTFSDFSFLCDREEGEAFLLIDQNWLNKKLGSAGT
jgi:hypothetical protein